MKVHYSVTIKEITQVIKEKKVNLTVPVSYRAEVGQFKYLNAIMENGQKIVTEARVMSIEPSNASVKEGPMCNILLEKGQ